MRNDAISGKAVQQTVMSAITSLIYRHHLPGLGPRARISHVNLIALGDLLNMRSYIYAIFTDQLYL